MPSTHSLFITVPTVNHPCCVTNSVSLSQPTEIDIHLIHNANAGTQHPVYTHTIVTNLGEEIKRISGASLRPSFRRSFSRRSSYLIQDVWWHT